MNHYIKVVRNAILRKHTLRKLLFSMLIRMQMINIPIVKDKRAL